MDSGNGQAAPAAVLPFALKVMQEIEQESETRIRKKDGNLDRRVGNLVWAQFVHKTARPVEGVPDPHLHAHCVVLNAVWDGQEHVWKAEQQRRRE